MGKLEQAADVSRKVLKPKYCAAVLVAAGAASRMGGVDKIMLPLEGEPLFLRTARAFEDCDAIREIVLVTRSELVADMERIARDGGITKLTAVVPGGASRQESVELGLAAVSKKGKLVAIQDGARPFVTPKLIDRVVRAAQVYGAAAPAIPVKDTIKTAKAGLVTGTPDRKTLFAVQTPQVFDYDLLRGALTKAEADKAEVTDDCSAVERMGMSVKLVEGDEMNFKITTPWDLTVARAYLTEGKQ